MENKILFMFKFTILYLRKDCRMVQIGLKQTTQNEYSTWNLNLLWSLHFDEH